MAVPPAAPAPLPIVYPAAVTAVNNELPLAVFAAPPVYPPFTSTVVPTPPPIPPPPPPPSSPDEALPLPPVVLTNSNVVTLKILFEFAPAVPPMLNVLVPTAPVYVLTILGVPV